MILFNISLLRYFNEANLALDHNHWTLMKQGTPNVPTVVSWLAKEANKYYQEHKSPYRIGIDPFVHPASFANDLTKAFEAENKDQTIAELVTTIPENLIDSIWSQQRPPIPSSPFRIHPIEYAGQSHHEKVKLVQSQLNEHKATLAIFCTLDDVAYLLNLRAMGDVATCPVGLAYVTVANDRVTLYCDARKIGSEDVKLHLSNVIIRPYDAIVTDLLAHVQESESNKVWMDTSRANLALASVVPKKQLLDQATIISQTKACKNEAEMEGMRRAHRVDGAAMAEFMAWLEKTLEERSVSEVEIDTVLTSCRAKQPGFLEVSFPTIAGVGSNGAIIHYRAKADSELLKYLDKTQPILIDSGGQYLYGTTDVTRTWHFGTPSVEFKNYYTRVLKGNIGVDTMIFPELTPGFVLDVMARKSLWEYGKDYGHGTGHGVGAALNVHEGPQSISPRWGNTEGLKNGMVVSNEPGYYEDGNFGIRIENLLEIAFVNPLHSNTGTIEANKEKKFLKFQKLTLIPIQKNLIDMQLMTKEELDWLDAYHQQVLEQVGPLLDEGSAAWKWLIKSCSPIDR
jgi:Xaa-Pro aminopeptidase